jgi:histone H3/H4
MLTRLGGVLMVRDFPLAPLEKIAREAGAERVSVSAVKALKQAAVDAAEAIAKDSLAASQHAGRVTIKASDIKIACR